jgi:hemoglobin-like flavoprotein
LIGTPAYLAPELWSGQSATTRSDIFAVGLVLFELLRGSLPFATLAGEALARAVVEVDIPTVRAHRPEIPPAFAAIIDKCLRRNALARYESAVELRRELEEIRAIYLTRADALDDVRLESEARLVADSFTRILSRSDALTSGVYERLFEADPDVRALFPADLDAQKDKLLHALRLAIEGLHQPDRIVELLRGLGRRHGAYGVLPSHFESLGLALQSTVRELDGDAWNDELARAWQRAYSFISTAMRQGLCEVGSTLVSDVDAAPPMAQSRSTSAISK